jgi:transposase-like protein
MPRPADPRKPHVWLEHIQRWQSSRLSVRVYCERFGLSQASFYAWKRTLQQRGLLPNARPSAARSPRARALQTPRFVPVALAGHDAAASGHLDVVLPDGCTVRVPVGFDAQCLRQLLAVLRERPC